MKKLIKSKKYSNTLKAYSCVCYCYCNDCSCANDCDDGSGDPQVYYDRSDSNSSSIHNYVFSSRSVPLRK